MGKLIVSDIVLSIKGDIVKLPVLGELAAKYNARILIDDAHSTYGNMDTTFNFGRKVTEAGLFVTLSCLLLYLTVLA